jgi:hypothetical protein
LYTGVPLTFDANIAVVCPLGVGMAQTPRELRLRQPPSRAICSGSAAFLAGPAEASSINHIGAKSGEKIVVQWTALRFRRYRIHNCHGWTAVKVSAWNALAAGVAAEGCGYL